MIWQRNAKFSIFNAADLVSMKSGAFLSSLDQLEQHWIVGMDK